jgi:hypothetical protein
MSAAHDDRSRGRFARLLKRELSRSRRQHWLASLPWVKLAQGVSGLVFALIIRYRPPSLPSSGEMLATVFWILILLPVLLSLLWPWRRLPSAQRLLREVEGRRNKSQVLETAWDHAAGRLDGKGYSPEILDSVLDRAVGELAEGLPAASQVPRRTTIASLGLVALALLLMLLPSSAGIRPLEFLVTPGDLAHYEERAWLEVSPGSVELLAGSDIELKAEAQNLPWRFSGRVKLEIDHTGDLPFELKLENQNMNYEHELKDIRSSFSYRFSRGRQQGDWHRVDIFHPPVLDGLELSALAPAYTNIPAQLLELHSGEVTLPEGSRLDLNARASSDLSEAWLRFEAGDSLPLSVDGRKIQGEFPLDDDRRIALDLLDTHEVRGRTPWLLKLRARADQGPEVDILAPEPDGELSRDMRTRVDILAADDYGVATLRLRAQVLGRPDTLNIPVPTNAEPAPRRAERVLWSLEGLQLFPGDIVEYWAEVWDNRPDSPQYARSATHRLQLPSLRELFDEIDREDVARSEDMDELFQEGRQMQEELRQLEEELRADPEVDWEKEEKLQEAFENQEELTEELSGLSDELQKRLEEMAANELLREETREKLEQIQQMMEELSGTEAGEILRRFEEMLAEMDPETLPDELAEMRMDQEALLEQLERTEELLEQILRDQKMDALLQQADELMQQQEQLKDETEAAEDGDASAKEMESLAERQEELAKESEALEEDVAETADQLAEDFPEVAEEMSEPQESPSESMSEAAEEMREEAQEKQDQEQQPQPEKDMPESGENSEQGDSGDQQQEAMKRLLKLYWRVVEAQSSMASKMDAEAMEGIERLTREALEFSNRVEAGREGLEDIHQWGSSQENLASAARRQMDLYRIIGRLREEMKEIASKSMAISRVAMREASRAQESLEASVAELEAQRASRGLMESNQALRHTNLTVVELLQGVQQMGQGGGSCNNPMGQMQSMLQQQEQLNKDSQGMKQQMGQGGLSAEQRAGMQRLRAEQEAVRRGLEELGGDEASEMLGSLDRILEEMQDVEKDLEAGRLTDETLRRQEKIFERLLDAQRSLHRQDFKRERQNRTGEDLAPLWPDSFEGDDPLEALREAIRRGLGEELPPEYEELIREYYRGLLDEQREESLP